MTRKRFIRLLMAEGVQRNQANDLALRMWLIHENYEQSYRHFELVKGHLPDLTVTLADYIAMMNTKIKQSSESIIKALESFVLNTLTGLQSNDRDNDN